MGLRRREENMYRWRWLDEMPFDHVFDVDGNEELCHATGRECCFDGDNPSEPKEGWNEYIDRNGEYHYGR